MLSPVFTFQKAGSWSLRKAILNYKIRKKLLGRFTCQKNLYVKGQSKKSQLLCKFSEINELRKERGNISFLIFNQEN